MSLNYAQPLFDPQTHYQIVVRGRVDVEWLQGFDSSATLSIDESMQVEEITVLSVHADQSGIVGLMRRLHGLGMTILRIQIVSDGGGVAGVEE